MGFFAALESYERTIPRLQLFISHESTRINVITVKVVKLMKSFGTRIQLILFRC